MAGTSSKSLHVKAFKITLSGLDGYQVKYHAYVQGKGWLGWQTTKSGTDIKSAVIARMMGKSLRIEAIEEIVEKVK